MAKTNTLVKTAAVGFALALGLAGCTSNGGVTQSSATQSGATADSSGDASAETSADIPVVAVALYPFEFLAEKIGGDQVVVENLATAAGHAHNLELSPSQVQKLADADLTLYLSQGFQPAIEDAINQTGAPALDGLSVIPEDELIQGDSHVWLDPLSLAMIGDGLAERLAEVNPDAAETYLANAAALRSEIEEVDATYKKELADCAGESFLTAHEAFGYLAKRYDLNQLGVTGVDPEAEPSPAKLRELTKIIEEKGITTLFIEPNTSEHQETSLGDTLGVEVGVLDTLEIQVDPDKDVIDVYYSNLESLKNGMSCAAKS